MLSGGTLRPCFSWYSRSLLACSITCARGINP